MGWYYCIFPNLRRDLWFQNFLMMNLLLAKPSFKKAVLIWLYTGLIMVFCMIAIGGITRLTESGLSITEWDVVMGSVPPLTQEAWEAEFDKYKTSPEYKHKNFDFTLSQFKAIYFWEFIHRLWGRLIGLVFFLPFLVFWMRKAFTKKGLTRLLFIFILGGFQGFLGWYMVQSGLVNEPRVSHYRLAMHLITALLTIALIWWNIMDISWPQKSAEHPDRKSFRKWISGFFVLFFIQLVYGAFVAGLDAGQYYNTWPKMGDQWVPGAVTAAKPFVNNFTENIAGIQFIHRTLAVILFAYVWFLWFRTRKTDLTKAQKKGVEWMTYCIILQFLLGVLTILMMVPVWLGLLHQLGAVLLMLASLYTAHRLWSTEKVVS